jgi:predicted DNA-binding transcriptional regulator YafY
LHPTQEILENHPKNGLTLAITVHLSEELNMLIRSYGSRIKVLKPEGLRQQWIQDMERCLKNAGQ